MRFYLSALIMFGALGCTQTPVVSSNPIDSMAGSDYGALVSKNTRHTNQYSGFYQTFQADVTILSNDVQTALLRQKAGFKGWDQKQFQMEREKSVQESSAYAKYFLRFFAPEHDYDDLDKPKTIWKVYLEYNGSRFEGKMKKAPEKIIELQALYPHMDRFSTGYEVTFSIPMTTVEQAQSKVVLTSSLGTAEFVFPAGK